MENIPNKRRRIFIKGFLSFLLLNAVIIGGRFIFSETIDVNFNQKNMPPTITHFFGTDWLGRDMFFRTVKGLSTSILVGVAASTGSGILAIIIGSIAATGSKTLDSFINWITDLFMGIPHILLMILISISVGKGLEGVVIAIVATHWPALSRVIRAEAMQLRTEPFVAISQQLGKSKLWIIRRHFVPHLLPQLVIGMVVLFPQAILHEASITFLGFGLPPEQPAIGIILMESMKYLSAGMWWLAFFPGVMLVMVVLLFEQLGESLKVWMGI